MKEIFIYKRNESGETNIVMNYEDNEDYEDKENESIVYKLKVEVKIKIKQINK